MATTKPIRSVSKTITPMGSNLILLDDGISMGKASLSDGVSAVASGLIDTAIDGLDLGTASQSDATDFATASQGSKADSAVQPDDIGTMATETASDYTKTSDLAAVATSNEYGDLTNLPTLGTGAALDAPSDPDLSNDTDKLALRGNVDANLVLQYAADDTALKGMDISTRKAALNLANEGWWLPTSDDISAEITAGDPRYLPTAGDATGASGGYYRVGSIASDQKYENLGARIERIADRAMLGGEAVKFNGLADGSGGKGGFLWDLLPGASASHAWMEQQTILSVGGLYDANGSIAINGYLAGPGIGINAHILHDRSPDTGEASGAWSIYGDARRDIEFGTTWAMELDIINGLPSPNTAFGPWGGNGSTAHGRTVALHLGSGGSTAINGTTYTADVALLIQKNSSTFYTGLAFGGQSLEPDSGTGRMHAIGMSPKQAIDWWGNNIAAGILASLVSNVTDTSVPQELAFQNLGLDYSSGGNTLFHVAAPANAATYINITPTVSGGSPAIAAAGTASAISLSLRSKGPASTTFLQSDASATFSATGVASGVNRLDALAAATGNAVQLRAQGTDANIDIQLTPKGTGNVRLGTHAAIAAETVTGYITIKDAGGTTRKLAVVS